MRDKINSKVFKNILIYAFFLIAMLFVLQRKENYMEDELLTYNLSNGKGWLEPTDGKKYIPADEPFIEYLASDGNLNIKQVWTRQKLDVHPPLYYLIVHIICCMFPYSVSIRYAGIINIVFQLLSLYILRKLIDCYTDVEKVKVITSLSYVFSAGILSITAFLRMYVMLGFWVLLISYIHIRNIERIEIKTCICLFFVTVAGALTHYHFILYAFLLSLVVGIYILIDKRFNEAIWLIITMGLAGVVSYLIFPSMVDHIFFEYRGEGSIENIKHMSFLDRFSEYYSIINKELFGGLMAIFICSAVFAFFLKENEDIENFISLPDTRKYAYLIVPSVSFFAIVAKSTPAVSDRYIYPVYPVLLVGMICLFYRIIKLFFIDNNRSVRILAVIMIICVTGGLLQCKWEWLYLDSRDNIAFAEEEGKEAEAICIYNGSWRLLPSYLEIKRFKSATFYSCNDDLEMIISHIFENKDVKICVFIVGLDDSDMVKIKQSVELEGYSVYHTGEFGYAKSLYLKRAN